jgi:ATP-dependent DNA ligase
MAKQLTHQEILDIRDKMPDIRPMKAGNLKPDDLDKLWNDSNWVAEEKLDGSRYILQFDGKTGVAKLTSRQVSVKTGRPVDKTENLVGILFPEIGPKELWGTTLDGEIVGQGGFGNTVHIMGSSPEKCQAMLKAGTDTIKYFIYDILSLCNKGDRKHDAYTVRRQYIDKIIKAKYNPMWHSVPLLPNDPVSFGLVLGTGGEGLILKRKSGIYIEDSRSKDWIKVKACDTYDGVIMGFNQGEGKYVNTLGALSIGQYIGGVLTEVATISGMTDEDRDKFWNNQNAYLNTCVEFLAQQKTPDKRYRHPRFVRCRPDKANLDCQF